MLKSILSTILTVTIFSVLSMTECLSAQRNVAPISFKITYQYAVKIVCCNVEKGDLFEPGNYLTTVNIHNPSYKTVKFKHKVALAKLAEDGQISSWSDAEIKADGAQYYTCSRFIKNVGEAYDSCIDGFFVIESQNPLDVQAVYTGAFDHKLRSLDKETITGRRIRIRATNDNNRTK